MPSSVENSRDSALRIRVVPEEVTLAVWPLRQQPLGSLVTLSIAAAVSWLVGWSAARPWVGVLAAVVLGVTLWRDWLPVTYELGLSGVSQIVLGRLRRIAWPAIRGYDVLPHGVLLVPDTQLTPLSPLRGLFVPWLDRRDQVLASIEYHLHSRGR
jgi:hypothetical protein